MPHEEAPLTRPTEEVPAVDPLLSFLLDASELVHVRNALLKDGFCVVPAVLTHEECDEAITAIWDFVEDSSSGTVRRSDPSSWYPRGSEGDALDPWPDTGYKSFSDMFQSHGAGWVLGSVREALAGRLFEPLFRTRRLHSSKEGFTFHRPTLGPFVPEAWRRRLDAPPMVCGKPQAVSRGEHFDQAHGCRGLHTIQTLVALEDQAEGVDGCFLCYPGSHDRHKEVTRDIYRGRFSWVPLTDAEIHRLRDRFGLQPRRVYLNKGDVVVWRSDLVHAALPPSGLTPRFRAVAYTSMQPAALTPAAVLAEKMRAYKQRETGDHRPHAESWHSHRRPGNPHHRPSFRTSPPLVSRRLAELYGLVRYVDTAEAYEEERERATIRGVRFAPESLPTSPPVRMCPARLEFVNAADSADGLVGQDKYMGGMPSPCGTYIYAVPGTARRVLRIHTQTNTIDWIGPAFEGKFKWLRGVEIPAEVMGAGYPRGCCIALPSNAPAVLKVNPESNQVTTFGEAAVRAAGDSGWFYHGGAVGANGMIYAIPANADRVMKIDPRTEQCWFVGPRYEGRQKWFGGILGSDGCVYGVPHNAEGVLRIDPQTDAVSVLFAPPEAPLPAGRWKYHGGAAVGDKIYGYPNNADNVLVVDVRASRVYTVGDAATVRSGRHRIPQDRRYKYLGGAASLDGKCLYLFPCDAERVLKIHVETDALELVGPLLLDGENKYQNGFCASDGCLYGIPQRATGILRIDGRDDHVDVMPLGADLAGVKDKFEGGVQAVDGSSVMYCIPLRARSCVKIIPGPRPPREDADAEGRAMIAAGPRPPCGTGRP